MRRPLRRLSVWISVPAVAAALLTAGAGAAYAGEPERAVVLLDSQVDLERYGVEVLTELPDFRMAVVEGTADEFDRLAAVPGVIGVTPDVPMSVTGKRDDKGKKDKGDRDKGDKGDKGDKDKDKGDKDKDQGDKDKDKGDKDKDKGDKDKGDKDESDRGTAPVYGWEGLGGQAGKDGAGAGVDVAVIDTGVSDTPSLNRASGRLIDGIDTSPLLDGGEPVTAGVFTDGYGHGTFMANLIAGSGVAKKDKNVGVAPGARVHVVKVADDDGNTSLVAVVVGLYWVAMNDDIEVANLALGVDRPMASYGPDPLNVAVDWVRDYSDIAIVVAAGNTAGQVSDPGFAPGAITVGAADTRSSRPFVADFSGSAVVAGMEKPDVVAPGVSLLSNVAPDSDVAVENPDSQVDGLWRGSGTSQSTAVVSGVAALFLAANPTADARDVKASLRARAREIGGADGAGLVRTTTRTDDSAGLGEESLDVAAWEAAALTDSEAGTYRWIDWLGTLWAYGPYSDESWERRAWWSDEWTRRAWWGDEWARRGWYSEDWERRAWWNEDWTRRAWWDDAWARRAWWGDEWTRRAWWGDDWARRAWWNDDWARRAWWNEDWTRRTWWNDVWAVADSVEG